ncbi:M42 family metallopeptidase [Roseiconus lacunae]|uniref:M42 family metallopeptidase n=1 Tax=Roseiconus lacunae TaxID=2605694 RepID=A0ABT7PMW4_9BACT|nr:M42 family metallopeptidase [Roseiconus lacunae]MDM4017826.1 M42 family metallopeptidase [Roseiconus lacunae]
MNHEARQFFEKAIQTPSPSGYEERLQQLVNEYISPHADQVSIDVHGNLIAKAGNANGPRLMYAGHCDQIGMLVSHIDENGFVYAQTIGGWDPQQLIGQAMTIWTDDGPVAALISRKPIHLLNDQERKKVVGLDEMWLDIGADGEAQARDAVRIGDPVTLQLQMRPLMNSIVCGPGMDNKTGMWTVIEALRRANEFAGGDLGCHLHSVSTVQEEIGLRGAKTAAGGINPDVAIAVDVTHASDCPTIDKNKQGNIRLGGGPVIFRGPNINPAVARRLVDLAEQHDIPYQMAAIGRATPNDANVLQLHGAGVATGLVAIPNRYMHSAVEAISLTDIDHVANLLARFAEALSPEDDFTPSVLQKD